MHLEGGISHLVSCPSALVFSSPLLHGSMSEKLMYSQEKRKEDGEI